MSRTVAEIVGAHGGPAADLGVVSWVPVVRSGRTETVGLEELLTCAEQIDRLAVVDPLARYALTRYLVAHTYLLRAYDNEAGGTTSWRAVAAGAAPLPPEAVAATIERCRRHWNLWHPTTPFLQSPQLRTAQLKTSTKTGPAALAEVTDPVTAIIAAAPSKSQEAWWGRDIVDRLDDESAAWALLVRHFCGSPGNEADVAVGSEQYRFGAGSILGFSWPQPIAHVFWEGANLAATLVANLRASVAAELGTDSHLFWEAPDDPCGENDPLWLYTSSAVATFLAQPESGPATRVLRSPAPYGRSRNKTVMDAARSDDPHTLRTAAAKPKRIQWNPEATQYQNLEALFRHVGTAADLAPCVLNDTYATYSLSDYRLWAVSTVSAGNPTGHRYGSVAAGTLDPVPYLLKGTAAAGLAQALARLAAPSRSVLSQLRYQVRQAFGDAQTPFDGDVARLLWARCDGSLGRLYTNIATAGAATPELLSAVTGDWRAAALDIFDDITTRFETPGAVQRRVLRARRDLKESLWRLTI